MRWPVRPPRPPRPEWGRVFALVPRLIGDTWVWLEPLERRVIGFAPPFTVIYEYRLAREVN